MQASRPLPLDRKTFLASPGAHAFVAWLGSLPWAGTTLPQEGAWSAVGPLPGAPVAWGATAQPRAGSAGRLAALQVHLQLPRSRFVPHAVDQVVPFAELPLHYIWRAPGMVFGDIGEASRMLDLLGQDLRDAVAKNDWRRAQALCLDVLAWGGERQKTAGARPQILALGNQLCAHLQACDRLMNLQNAVLTPEGDLPGVPYMGSMWVKIYALMTGTPIYDSRVAAAIATLVECWREDQGLCGQPLPPELTFPSVPGRATRQVTRRYPHALSPGVLVYGGHRTAARWAGATVRLGWLIEALIGRGQDKRLAFALEASLFMAGYDCGGINPPTAAAAAVLPAPRANLGGPGAGRLSRPAPHAGV